MTNPRNTPARQLSLFGDDEQAQPIEPTPIIDNSNIDDLRPLPLIVADKWGFRLQYHIIDNVYWFSLHDWVKGIIGGASPQTMIANLTRSMTKSETLFSKQRLDYEASDGKVYQRDYVTDNNLYTFSQQMRAMKKHPLVAIIKKYLADAGAFTDLTRRKPEAASVHFAKVADRRKYTELVRGGMTHDEAMQWISVRGKQPAKTITLRDTWKARGIRDGQYGTLTNVVTQVATGRTATEHKLALKVNNSREGLSAYENAVITVVETVSDILHNARDSHGIDELTADIQDSDGVVNRDELARQMSKKRPRLTDGR